MAVQVAPLSVERKTPAVVPANMLVPDATNADVEAYDPKKVSPEFPASQLTPLSVERKTPPPSVPTKIAGPPEALGFTPTAVAKPPYGPFDCNH
jgi:hypothetical protein